MRTLLMLAMLAGFSASACAETIKADVNGLVCAFCASGIEKTFRKQPEVESVKVDLEEGLVTIETKEGQSLSDDKITSLITDAGYTVTKIRR